MRQEGHRPGNGTPTARRKPLIARACALLALAAASACTTGNVFTLEPAVDVGTQTAAIIPTPPVETLAPPVSEPLTAVAYPRMDMPALPTDTMPADQIACRQELRRLGVAFTEVEPIEGSGECGIAHPVRVTAIGSVAMKPAATLTCDMAASFATWTKKELVPAARWRYFSGVRAINQGSSYSCRRIAGERTLSEHGKGNALDVMSIELTNGDKIDVRKPGLFSFRQRGFLNTVRADGCQYFTTVLGPGYNYDHRNHFHFDIKARKNGYRACR
ncbi:extensin-like domain-containing protein [Aquamicrobium soli]|uniref:Extensin family protein n=1 Tax=Aquamicrobium soli TaxID=1811518 RepID=A0ABV7KDC4_9HYPH